MYETVTAQLNKGRVKGGKILEKTNMSYVHGEQMFYEQE